jgi:hypothetical protein
MTERLIRPGLPFTSRIVLHLSNQLSQSAGEDGFHSCTDCFYTSSKLAAKLLEKRIHLTGTVKKSRTRLQTQLKWLKIKKCEI